MAKSPEGQNWEQFLWLIPEGVRLGPDRDWWYRIGDLTNGANQGPAMHALEMVVGIDDARPDQPRILPRIPRQLGSISIEGFPMLVADGGGTRRVRIDFYKYAIDCAARLGSDCVSLWSGALPEVHLAVTHGVLLPSALKLLDNPVLKQLVISDTIRQLESVGSAALVDHRVIDALVDAYRSFRQAAHRLSLEERPPLVPAEPFAVRRRRVWQAWKAVMVAGADPPPL